MESKEECSSIEKYSPKVVFIITSMINCKSRTVYSPQQRLEQTLKTIDSIKNSIEINPFCLLVELSELTEYQETILNDKLKSCNNSNILNLSKDLKAQFYSNEKSLGDIYSTIQGCLYLKFKYPNLSRIYKISGRYYLDERFNSEKSKLERDNCKILFKKGELL